MDYKSIYNQIIKGIKDYFRESGFKKAILGLSGGMDSSLVAVLIYDAAGGNNLNCIFMPTEFTSEESRTNAYRLCRKLKIDIKEIDITVIIDKYLEILGNKEIIKGINIPEENLQARIRGNILMWYGNREHALVIATGNRSEILTGYCTLYGDTVGALAPIGNLYKTEVYELAKWINKNGEIIPESIFKMEPSAELNIDQKDEEELYPYEILDNVLKLHFDEGMSISDIAEKGFEREIVEDIVKRVDKYRFKRKQLPPAIEIKK